MDFKKILFKTKSIDVDKSLPDAVIFVGNNGKIQYANDVAAEILETSKMHLMTSDIADFIENIQNLVDSAQNTNKPVIAKLVNKEVYYDMTVRVIDEGYILDLRDATESSLKSANNEDAGVINREKNNFLLKLTNDLKSPIQSIVGFSQAMADGLGGEMSEQQEKYIKIINKNSSELMYFIVKLLELSETESSIKQVNKKTFDIIALANSVVKFNEQLYKGKNISINVIQDENLKKAVSTDSSIVKNILQNILEVILKSIDMGEIQICILTPDDEYLTSKNIKQGNYILISISSGAFLLSENDLDCMFDPYKIVDSTNRKNVLRAIVLASVKNLVQSIDGTVWVESQILKSTSFNVLIPVA